MFKEISFSEKSNNVFHYINETQFAVYNKKIRGYINNSFASSNIEKALLFGGYRFIDKKHDSVVVYNEDGEAFIDKNGRCLKFFDFIGEACADGIRPVKRREGGINKWGYLPKEIDPQKKPILYPKENDAFFLATNVCGYKVNGYDYGDSKSQWLLGYNRRRILTSKRINGIQHDEFQRLPNSNLFFLGITINSHNNKIITIYRASRVEDKKGHVKLLSRPFNSPDVYSDVKYLGKGLFLVSQTTGLLSILYFDKDESDFKYWPETDRRNFTHYTLEAGLLFAKNAKGYFSVIHKELGDLTRYWDKVMLVNNQIFYEFDGVQNTVDVKDILNSYERTVSLLKEGIQNSNKIESRNKESQSEPQKGYNKMTDSMLRKYIDWVALISSSEMIMLRKSFDVNFYDITIPNKLINAPADSKLLKGDKVIILNLNNAYLLIGEIFDFDKDNNYILRELDVKNLKLDFSKFSYIINKGHIFIKKECLDRGIEKEIYSIIKDINKSLEEQDNLFEQKQKDESDFKKSQCNQPPITNKLMNTTIQKIKFLYEQIKDAHFAKDKIYRALEILFEESIQESKGSNLSLLEEYANSLSINPNYNEIMQEIKGCLSEEEYDEFIHRYKMGLKYKSLPQKDSITIACKNISSLFGKSLEWVYPKLEPIIPNITVIDFIKHICSSNYLETKDDKVNAEQENNKIESKTSSFNPKNVSSMHKTFTYRGIVFRVGDVIPSDLIKENRRIYFKKDPGILFIKITNKDVVSNTAGYKYKIEGVGQYHQEFLPNNENSRILHSKEPIVLIKETSENHYIYFDLVGYSSHIKVQSQKGQILEFILKPVELINN